MQDGSNCDGSRKYTKYIKAGTCRHSAPRYHDHKNAHDPVQHISFKSSPSKSINMLLLYGLQDVKNVVCFPPETNPSFNPYSKYHYGHRRPGAKSSPCHQWP